jgi:mono/diheme cytochrome c family protein
MRRGYVTAATLVLLGAAAGVASAQQAAYRGSAAAGREVALYNCDACHIVAANQELRPLISGYAPSFFDIANKPTTTEASLREFLSHTHAYANMPYPDLASRDLADVVAYILGLRGRR